MWRREEGEVDTKKEADFKKEVKEGKQIPSRVWRRGKQGLEQGETPCWDITNKLY